MTVLSDAKSLLASAKKFEVYSRKLEKVAEELKHHHHKYSNSSSDKEKEHHLKKHYISFANATKIKHYYSQAFTELIQKLKHLETELENIKNKNH